MSKKVLNIGMIDADLIDNGTKHPNLAQMKMSAYCKKRGHNVELCINGDYSKYDLILISQVFNYTKLPIEIQLMMGNKTLKELNTSIISEIDDLESGKKHGPIISLGGTGFFSDGGRNLDNEIEHILPDYHLYDEFINQMVLKGKNIKHYADYLEYSIGFTTRGCFRRCSFCVNKKYKRAVKHSPISEFLDESRPKIYLWDDNILAFNGWKKIFDELNATGKPFQFRQGIDIRLLVPKRAKVLAESRYHGDFIFAFDHIEDRDLISHRLHSWRKYCSKTTKLYVLCAYDPTVWYKEWCNTHLLQSISESQLIEFELQDVINTLERIKILMKYGCNPYIMRYEAYQNSHFKDIYIQLARWCNQPEFYKKKSFKEFCLANQENVKTAGKIGSAYKAMLDFEEKYPDIAASYFNLKYENENEYNTITTYGRSPFPCPICTEEKLCWSNIVKDEVPIKKIIKNYFSRHIDIICLTKSTKKCTCDIDIASRKLIKILHETTIETILQCIDELDPLLLDSNLIPQPGEDKTNAEDVLRVLRNGKSLSYIELGKQLSNPGKSKIAYTKYGESYGKYAALLDVVNFNETKPVTIQLNPIGKALIEMPTHIIRDFFIKETIRIPIVQNLLRDAKDKQVFIKDYLEKIVSGTTIDRRILSVKFFLNYIQGFDEKLDSRLNNII